MRLQLEAAAARHGTARDGRWALSGLGLSVQAGEQVAVIGPSGAGKTTLVQLAAGALRPAAGRVLLDGTDPCTLRGAALRRLRGRLFLAPQLPPLPPRQRVVTAVLAGRLPAQSLWAGLRSLVYPSGIEAAQAALAAFDLADKLFDRVDRLSGGERQRVALARILVSPASLWLVDEPLSALDPPRARQALAVLQAQARARGATLVATLHQVDLALAGFTRIVALRDGRLAFDLPARDVTPARLADLYAQHEHELQGGTAWHPPAPTPPAPPALVCR